MTSGSLLPFVESYISFTLFGIFEILYFNNLGKKQVINYIKNIWLNVFLVYHIISTTKGGST
jgi:hypothetical protein